MLVSAYILCHPLGDNGRSHMLRRSNSTRTAAAVLAAGLGLSLVAVIPSASAAPASNSSAAAPAAAGALQAAGPFAAAADASLLTLDLPSVSPAILPQTNVDLARSTANAESDADIDADKPGAQRTAASAGTTGTTSLLGAPISIQENNASAPAAEANEDILIPLDLSPLLNLEVIRTTALANWVSDTACVDSDTPLSYADQSLADLELIGDLPNSGSVLDLDTDDDDGAADTEAATFLASIPGNNDPRAIQARVTTDISSANVLNNIAPGISSLIQLDVVQTPNYVVSASGLPGGASVTGQDPVVNVSIGGDPIITLDTENETFEAALTDLVLGDLLDLDGAALLPDLLNDLGLGGLIPIVEPIEDAVQTALRELQPVVRLSIPVVKQANPDGTTASVQASLLRVEILPPAALGAAQPLADILNQILGALGADLGGPLLKLDLGPLGASVVAPAGGITCGGDNPLSELNKHASALEVAPGGTFEYNIAVPNRGPCTVEDVTVTDVVTGPAGFEIVGTEPPATSANGGSLTFELGDLAPNETRNITITIKVPDSAKDGDTFDDAVTASGTCDGENVTEDDRVDDIPVVRDNFSGPCSVQFSNKDASHIQVFPGETFSYYVHAFNSGAQPCTNVKITDTLDPNVDFVSCNKGCTHSGNTVTWNLSTLGGGSSAILSVVVQVQEDTPKGTVLENVAVIDPDNGDPVTVSTKGPVVGDTSIPKDPAPARRGRLPKTGAALPLGVAAGLGLGALALQAIRRKSVTV